MEINVGDYVRTKDGIIEQVRSIVIHSNNLIIPYTINCKGRFDGEIIKHSKDIIDLIKAGDYVNGSKVIDVRTDEELEIGVESDNLIYHYIQNKDIKSILTHEQFDEMKYEVKECTK